MTDNTFYEGGATASGNAEASPVNEPPGMSSQTPPDTGQKEDEVITSTKLNSILAELEDKFQRNQDRVVSLVDKRIAKAKEESQRAIEMLKKSGMELTPAQESQISRTAVEEAMLDSQPEPEPNQESSNQQIYNQITQMVNSEVRSIMQNEGVYVSPEEIKILIPNGNELSPFQFISKVKDIVQNKKNNQQTAPNRIPTLASSGGSPANEDTLKQQYQQEIAQIMAGKHPTIKRGQTEAITKLKSEYAKKGLKGIY